MPQFDLRLFSLLIMSVFSTLSGDQTVHRRGYCIDSSSFNNAVSTIVFILKPGMGIVKMTIGCQCRYWGKQAWPVSRWCHCIVWISREKIPKTWPRFLFWRSTEQFWRPVYLLYSSLNSNLRDVFVWTAG